MLPATSTLEHIVHHLTLRGVRFALVGGLGVSVHVAPRFTKDVDLAVLVADDAEAERIVSDLAAAGYFVDAVVEQKKTGRLATVRLLGNGGDGLTHVDLLFASSGIEHEIVDASSLESVTPLLRIPVARPGHLVALKLLAVGHHRPQDPLDLNALKSVMTDPEWKRAEEAVALIEKRGFHRDRELSKVLAKLRNDEAGF